MLESPSASRTSSRVTVSAGITPKMIPEAIDAANAKAKHRRIDLHVAELRQHRTGDVQERGLESDGEDNAERATDYTI